MSNTKLDGEFTVNRYSNTDTIAVKIHDSNGCLIAIAEMTAHNFALAVTGLSHVDCAYGIWPDYAGKTREAKDELIPVPDLPLANTYEAKASYLAQFEVDGWKAHINDLGNHHKLRGDKYLVSFVRYVDK